MKQILITSSLFLVLMSASMVGYHVVSANEKVEEIKDQITIQADQEVYLTPYGYTLENPNIILDPYGTSPLTAMILFETEKPEEVTITVHGKDKETTFTNTFKSTSDHIIPIYGLYPNTENKIEIKCGNLQKTYSIQTESLPQDFISTTMTTSTEGMTLNQTENYIYGVDKNQEIRWLYKNNTDQFPYLLENGNLLVSINLKEEGYNGLIEIDLTGKIYKQYTLENPYNGLVLEQENSLFIVSKNLIELDKQTGVTLNTYPLDNTYEQIFLDESKTNIILENSTETKIINLKNKEQINNPNSNEFLPSTITIQPYTTNINYRIRKGIKFQNQTETEQSPQNILLVGYKKPDNTYKKYNIKINQAKDNIQISGEFSDTDEIYIILDKFLDKRVYDLTENYITIHKEGLSGKYSIYIKINNTIYKTNTYVNF